MAALEGVDFLEKVRCFGGIPRDIDVEEEFKNYIVEKLKFDFVIISKYCYVPDPVVDIRVTTINGRDDPHVTSDKVIGWSKVTTAETAHHVLDGDHFYFHQQPEAVARIIGSLAAGQNDNSYPPVEVRLI